MTHARVFNDTPKSYKDKNNRKRKLFSLGGKNVANL